jgi:hypothetical protein
VTWRDAVRYGLDRLLFAIDCFLVLGAPTRIVHGVRIVDATGSQRTDEFAERLAEAMTLLQAWSPRHYARVCRAFRHIVVANVANPSFVPLRRSCWVDVWHLATPPGQTALMLVHEATHARIEAYVRTRPTDSDRTEALCFRSQRDAAAYFPESERVIDWLRRAEELRHWRPAGRLDTQRAFLIRTFGDTRAARFLLKIAERLTKFGWID